MDIRELTADLSVGSQIAPEDVKAIADRGFRTILVNRPDGEAPGQPTFAEIAAAAEEHGLEVRHVPVVSGHLTQDDVQAFGQALEELPGPVFAYCRSGTRSCHVWALGRAGRMDTDEIMAAGARGGYDLSPLRPSIEAMAQRS